MGDNVELERALRMVGDFRRDLELTPGSKVDLLEQERRVQEVANGIARELMREVFVRADVKEPEVVIDGVRWGNRREVETTYTTKSGDIRVSRGIFSKPGGGPVMVPLELRLGIVEGRYTPALARVMTRARASLPASEAEALLREVGVAAVSASTLHRIPKAIAARYETRREQVNEQLREAEVVPEEAVGALVGLDGVMVPQDGELAKARGRKTETPSVPRHEAKYGPVVIAGPAQDNGEQGRTWHEGSVGTVTYFDKDGEQLRTIYLARMPEAKMATLASEIELELQNALALRPTLDVCFGSDGDKHQWTLLEAMAARLPRTAPRTVGFLLDFFHAAEYLTEAAELTFGEDSADSHAKAAEWREILKHAQDGAERVLKSLRYHRGHLPKGKKRQRLQVIIDYLATNKKAGRLKYAQAIAANKPIGTGVTEAAAKTVVNVPMKRAGARFDQHGGQTVMLFRAAVLSERFELLSSIMEGTYTANVVVPRAA
jgi:hypothetical protein